MLKVFFYLFTGVLIGYVLPDNLFVVFITACLFVLGGQLLVKLLTEKPQTEKKEGI